MFVDMVLGDRELELSAVFVVFVDLLNIAMAISVTIGLPPVDGGTSCAAGRSACRIGFIDSIEVLRPSCDGATEGRVTRSLGQCQGGRSEEEWEISE